MRASYLPHAHLARARVHPERPRARPPGRTPAPRTPAPRRETRSAPSMPRASPCTPAHRTPPASGRSRAETPTPGTPSSPGGSSAGAPRTPAPRRPCPGSRRSPRAPASTCPRREYEAPCPPAAARTPATSATPSHAPAPSTRHPAPAQRTSHVVSSTTPKGTRPSQTAAIPAYRVRAYAALPACAYARAQKPRRMAAIPGITGKGIRVPAYAGCISRLLAPKVARPSRRPRSALQLHAPASRRVPHSVSQPTPPQGAFAPATDPRRHGLSNSVAPAARKRSASAAAGACCAVTLRTAPSPLRAAPSAVFPRAPQAPFRVLLRRGRRRTRRTRHK